MLWGFAPAPDTENEGRTGGHVINARAESVGHKRLFKDAFLRRRCLIPAGCFFEWRRARGQKRPQPMKFWVKDQPLFAMAGIWERAQRDDGAWKETFCVITTRPNALLARVHDRMPVILPPELENDWLGLPPEDGKKLLQMLEPYPAKKMDACEVSRAVNSPANDAPHCLEAVPEAQGELFGQEPDNG